MVEMKDIQLMTEKATVHSLVIIDELGRGTSTAEGMAIAQAVIEYVHHHIGCKALVSTHFHELAYLEGSLPSLANARMAVEESGDHVTFLRKLISGAADTSYGIYCAQLAGLPKTIIGRAYELLEQLDAVQTIENTARQEAGAASAVMYEKTETSEKPHVPKMVQEQQAQTASIVQLSIFDEPAQQQDPSLPKKKGSAKEELLVNELRKLDLMNVTPMQAMQWLNDMKNKIMN